MISKSNGTELAGELCLPAGEGPFPTVIMVHGSGPLDRDENTRGQSLNIFNTIADNLATEGIASFRYDKRGCGESDGDYFSCGHHDLVDDASACIEHLATVESCDRQQMFVLGHSEGTIIAAQLAVRHPQLAGLVMLCPFIESMESILRRQSHQMQNDLKQAKGLRRILYACFFAIVGDPVSGQEKFLTKLAASDAPTFRMMLQKVNAKWLRELTPVTQHIVPDLTHILRFDRQPESILNYGNLLKEPMEPTVCRLVADWIGEHKIPRN